MLKEYLAELQKTPLLTREEEAQLWQLYAGGDREAYNKLMTSYQPLVFKIAAGFKMPEPQLMELVQEGMLGLLEAAERYDYKPFCSRTRAGAFRWTIPMLRALPGQRCWLLPGARLLRKRS